MKQNRLFRIIYYLIDRGYATSSELADKFEVSVRTIYRDIDVLSQSGVPVYTEPGRNGGIYLMSDFVLEKALLSDKEKKDILTALQGLPFVGDSYESDTLEKLSSLFKLHAENWYELDFSRWGNSTHDNDKFELLKSAIIRRHAVEITYAGSNNFMSRKIHPIKLMYKSRAWYLKAYCTEREDFRIFKLSRIIDLKLLEEKFLPIAFPAFQDKFNQEFLNITLSFSKDMAYRVYDEFDASEVSQQDNGNFIVTAEVPYDSWLVGFLLSFGSEVEIIEPEFMRTILAEKAKEIYEMNKS